jgi:transposase InsO family protein
VPLSRSTYYRDNKATTLVDKDRDIIAQMHSIASDSPKYGYRRMTPALLRKGLLVNHKKVLRLMHQESLICRRKKRNPITTMSNHGHPIYPNLVLGKSVTKPNQYWVSDMTYIRLGHEFVYLAVILDLFSRRCVGWALSRNIDSELTLSALRKAIEQRKHLGLVDLTHHSDQGVQYASKAYTQMLTHHGISISMSRRGNVYDNAWAESFMKTLKVEEVYMNEYITYSDVVNNIEHFIEEVYNKKRLHSSIGYMTPQEFEENLIKLN